MTARQLASFIKLIRTKNNLSQGDLARKTGLARSYISRLEDGEYKSPSLMTLVRLAKGLGIPSETIFNVAGVKVQDSKLPSFDVYLRTKYNLTEEAIDEVERFLSYIKSQYADR